VTAEIVDVAPCTILAAVGTVADHSQVPERLLQLLDQAWAYIRGSNVEGTGHNVVVYRIQGSELTGGVQVADDTPEPPAPLVLAAVPGGRVAHVRHVGPYHQIPQSVQKLFAWCGEHNHAVAEPMWEVYGDWTDDESQLVTDLYVALAE
jgi:hypothetical protein